MTLLAAPTASLVASFYLDDIADVVERDISSSERPRRAIGTVATKSGPLHDVL
jgi:uncharacterized protein involved in cysteine biosynthesis